MVKELISAKDFEDFIKDDIVLVDFYATWCGPCKMLAPIVEEISNSGVKCGKMDIDKNIELAMKKNFSYNSDSDNFSEINVLDQHPQLFVAPVVKELARNDLTFPQSH